LLNYLLILMNYIGYKKVAFWGHGKNMQIHLASRLGEATKRFISRRVHWWFTYNDLSSKIVKEIGYPSNRISSVNNAIDTIQIDRMKSKFEYERISDVKKQYNIKGQNIGIYIGAMYKEKRLEFLIESCTIIRSKLQDFEMIFIGTGPEYYLIENASKQYIWIHPVGPKFNSDIVPFFALAKVLLMPGLMGLAVLDSFAFEVPIVTTDINYHSPEIAYLVSGYNGLILNGDVGPNGYADAVVGLLKNEQDRQQLVKGCHESKYLYTVEMMAERFKNGIIKALAQ
jgi:L-malate glycosyltransferase